jgi:Fur family zinc uptake transcriptional regulator
MSRPLDMPRHREQALLAFLQGADTPVSAYNPLKPRRAADHRLAPTAVYRALARLDRAGFIQRRASVNARIARPAGPSRTSGLVALCGRCGAVEDIRETGATQTVTQAAARSGFTPVRAVIEVHGRCARCDTRDATGRDQQSLSERVSRA